MSYTILVGAPATPGTATASRDWLRLYMPTTALLRADHLLTLAEVVSSGWSTGFDFLSTEDGLTMGFRRRASSGLARMLRAHRIRVTLPTEDGQVPGSVVRACEELARQEVWWREQWRDFVLSLSACPSWCREGREIALWCRASNSAPSWVSGCHSYSQLRNRYSKHPRGESRIERLERLIPAEEVWR